MFSDKDKAIQLGEVDKVSIPSKAGHVFGPIRRLILGLTLKKSQSLPKQVMFSDPSWNGLLQQCFCRLNPFQSRSCFRTHMNGCLKMKPILSLNPFQSRSCFRTERRHAVAVYPIRSQSLLKQVMFSDKSFLRQGKRLTEVSIPSKAGHVFGLYSYVTFSNWVYSLNPFQSRSCFRTNKAFSLRK